MKQYTIYCSDEQTKKALELGAPIEYHYPNEREKVYHNPTAEQMISWIEEHGIWEVSITRKWGYNGWFFYLYNNQGNDLIDFETKCSTRKEATLAVIDAALDYLSKEE